MLRYDWPGNARELRNLIESLTLMSTDREVTLADLSDDFRQQAPIVENAPHEPVLAIGGASLEDAERLAIERAIDVGDGNLSWVAKQLKISRSTLYRKIKQYGIGR